jgi:aryl-alcohol dehydrogenase-like predicted oxidoreductase
LIGTKVALEAADLADIREAVLGSVERSLRRLGVEHVDIVHLHNRICLKRTPASRAAHGPMLTVDEMLGPGGIQHAFEDLQREGKLRFFGFCAFGGEMAAVQNMIDKGRFHSMLALYNVFNPSAGRHAPASLKDVDYKNVISRAALRGIGVVALRVVAAGALSGSARPHHLNRGGPAESGG